LKIEGDGKQMIMMDIFWSQSRWRHDDGFAENIFTGVARLGIGVPAPPPGKIFGVRMDSVLWKFKAVNAK
jgi:hypothetical protein